MLLTAVSNFINQRHHHNAGAARRRQKERQERDEYITGRRTAVSAGGVLMRVSFSNGQSHQLFIPFEGAAAPGLNMLLVPPFSTSEDTMSQLGVGVIVHT